MKLYVPAVAGSNPTVCKFACVNDVCGPTPPEGPVTTNELPASPVGIMVLIVPFSQIVWSSTTGASGTPNMVNVANERGVLSQPFASTQLA